MNDTDELFKYDIKTVEKVNSSTFIVDCETDLFVDLDDEWHVSTYPKNVKLFILKRFSSIII